MRLLARLLPFLAVLALLVGPGPAAAAGPYVFGATGKVRVTSCPSAGASAAAEVGRLPYILSVEVEWTCVCFGPTTCGKDNSVNAICLYPGQSIEVYLATTGADTTAVSCYSDGGAGVMSFTRYTLVPR